jgi:hypothetical protein
MGSCHKIIVTAMVLGCLCLVRPASVCRAAEPGFTVDSYIPDYFYDFEWRIDGGMRLLGGTGTLGRDIPFLFGADRIDSHTSDRQSLDFSSHTTYRYQTIPHFLKLTLGAIAHYDHINALSSHHTDDPGNLTDFTDNSSNNHSYNLQISPTFDGGVYIFSDFLLSATFGFQYDTRGTFSGKSSDYTEHVDVIGIDSTVRYIVDRTVDNSDDRKAYSADIAVMPGWGRVYEGYFAATALYMIDELRREGRLNREPTPEEMRELCDLIYHYRLKHPVDTRLLKIDALQHVMDFFIERNIIGDPGPYGYLLIQDVWDYFPRQSRLFGFRFRVGPGISFTRYRSDRSMDEDRYYVYYFTYPTGNDTINSSRSEVVRSASLKNEYRRTYLAAMAEYHKPLDIRWQLDALVSARYYPDAYRISNSSGREYYSDAPNSGGTSDLYTVYNAMYRIDATGVIWYILNSRTSSNLSIGYIRDHYNSALHQTYTSLPGSSSVEPVGRDNQEIGYLSLRGTLVYRLAIPTTLTVLAEYDHQTQEIYQETTTNRHDHGYEFSVMISHYLY